MITIFKLLVMYEPLRTFTWVSLPFLIAGVGLWLRYAVIWLQGEAERGSHVQSILVGSVALLVALFIFMMGLIGELIAINRRMHEETLYYVKRLALSQPPDADQTPPAQDDTP
jgi:hypothetical protein